jgi:glycerol-1-phosphate dehydrogenase [NAD(P)+]
MAAGEAGAIETLVRLLVLSGLGMVLAGSSAPASQAEHLVSHHLDMMAHPASLHGEQVGVATLSISRLQQRLLASPQPPALRPAPVDEAAILRHFGPELGPACVAELAAKPLDPAAAARLAADWPAVSARLGQVMLPTADLVAALNAAGAPTTPAGLGIPDQLYRDALTYARAIRSRYTCLDLAGDAGLLDAFVARGP